MADIPSSLGASCPSGGTFYVCLGKKTEFVGCCTINPCTTGYQREPGTCPPENLRPASFSKDSYLELPAQECAGSDESALWYTCAYNSPPFLGCCKVNPCVNKSCPTDQLVAARLSPDPDNRQIFVGAAPTSTAEPTSRTETSSTSTPTPTAETDPRIELSTTTPSSNSGLPPAAIGGIAAGAAVLVIALVAFLLWRWRRSVRRNQDNHARPFVAESGGYQPTPALKPGVGYEPTVNSAFSSPESTPYLQNSFPGFGQPPKQTGLGLSPAPYDPHKSYQSYVPHGHSRTVSEFSQSPTYHYQSPNMGPSPNMAELSAADSTAFRMGHDKPTELAATGPAGGPGGSQGNHPGV
ncbi:hypothetical protein QBC40DRAFT_283140 [Triangularia verruculosa]|uniref:Uncharacterized protein n=1 Tax=Triangularia verruculosa TaxID=2587418 RepID=A0AAN6XE16_9PEZI|nr:hypothetical protein QBC40DRAFT_283140 [Triangularia verruculosa]